MSHTIGIFFKTEYQLKALGELLGLENISESENGKENFISGQIENIFFHIDREYNQDESNAITTLSTMSNDSAVVEEKIKLFIEKLQNAGLSKIYKICQTDLDSIRSKISIKEI